MTTVAVWEALEALAAAWRRSRCVADMAEKLPPNCPAEKLLPAVAKLEERGHMAESHPLQIYKAFPHMGLPIDAATAKFMADSERLERSLVTTVCWIRSRLPHYPMIPAPHLAKNSFHMAAGVNFNVPWSKEALGAGFQFQSIPSQVDVILRASVGSEVAALAEQLVRTPQWLEFGEAFSCVDSEAKRELLDARKKIANRVQELEAAGLLSDDPRVTLNQRKAVTHEIVGELPANAKKFADAFSVVDDLINLVTVEVFSQLIAFGLPAVLSDAHDIEIDPGPPPEARFDSAAPGHVSRLYWVDHPLIRDAVQMNQASLGTHVVHGTRLRYSGRILTGTGQAWRR